MSSNEQQLAKVLFIGDTVGAAGFKAVVQQLSGIKQEVGADFCIVNGENIVKGKGLSAVEAKALFEAGADVITTGNHIWENWKARPLLAEDRRVLRPLNYPRRNPGWGYVVMDLLPDVQIGVLQIQGRVYMQSIDCPFAAAEKAVARIRESTPVVFVDFHAEATAEKGAMAWFLDGQVSCIAGTHTHIQTNDARIMPQGTAFITDVGMSGPFDSVLGLRKDVALRRFTLQTPHKYEEATDDVRISGITVTIDVKTGNAQEIKAFTLPDFTTSVL